MKKADADAHLARIAANTRYAGDFAHPPRPRPRPMPNEPRPLRSSVGASRLPEVTVTATPDTRILTTTHTEVEVRASAFAPWRSVWRSAEGAAHDPAVIGSVGAVSAHLGEVRVVEVLTYEIRTPIVE